GRLDDDGWLYLVGRKKDIVIRGGENVACAHVEARLRAPPMWPRSPWSASRTSTSARRWPPPWCPATASPSILPTSAPSPPRSWRATPCPAAGGSAPNRFPPTPSARSSNGSWSRPGPSDQHERSAPEGRGGQPGALGQCGELRPGD